MNDTQPTSSRSLAAASTEDGGVRNMLADVRINPRYKGLIQAIGRAISESVVRCRRDCGDELQSGHWYRYDYGDIPISVSPRAGNSDVRVSVSLPFGWIDDAFERECYEADEAAAEKELDDRAMAAADAVFREAAAFYRDWEVCESEFPFSRMSLAYILRPFLQSKPKPKAKP